MNTTRASLTLTPRPDHPCDVRCTCRKLLYDGAELLLLSRVTRFRPDGAWATCKVCKREVKVPVTLTGAAACASTPSPLPSSPQSPPPAAP